MICCLTCFLELRILNEMTIIQIKQIAEQNTRKCSFNWQLFAEQDAPMPVMVLPNAQI